MFMTSILGALAAQQQRETHQASIRGALATQQRETPQDSPTPPRHAQRPVIVLKQARAGSSWFGQALSATGGWCRVQNEVVNRHNPWCDKALKPTQEQCQMLGTMVTESFRCSSEGVAGFTMSPFGFGCHNPKIPSSCWKVVKRAIEKARPFVVTLTRRNVVLQAASLIRSNEVLEDRLCADPYHLELCSEDAAKHRAAPDPASLLEIAKKKQHEAKDLRRLAAEVAHDQQDVLHLTMEDLLEEDGHLQLPKRVLRKLGVEDPRSGKGMWLLYEGATSGTAPEAVDAWASAMRINGESPLHEGGGNGGVPKLKTYVQNYFEIEQYFEAHASEEMLEMVRQT